MLTLKKLAAWGAALATLAALGCGDGHPQRVPVSGKVMVDGQPLTKGYIRFVPANGRASGADIQPDGSFTLACYDMKNPDGALLGEHAISVVATEPAGSSATKWLVPQKYRDHTTSELKQTIDGPKSDLVVNLTWDGKAPFVEKFSDEGAQPAATITP
ncbi:MAG TPA: hypothetical protein VGE52_09470 [Pirellulales bacterium]